MAPIEVFFGVIIFLFALIGLVRGFLRELGVTTVVVLVLFFLSQFEPYLDTGVDKVVTSGVVSSMAENTGGDLIRFWIFAVVLMGVAFVSYQGETLAFPGDAPTAGQGVLLGSLTGLLNGYLIAGSIWYYMDKYHYPVSWLGFSADKLSSLAQDDGRLPALELFGTADPARPEPAAVSQRAPGHCTSDALGGPRWIWPANACRSTFI